jgi:hypothetical protein
MNFATTRGDELEKLVDRHIELCERFVRLRAPEHGRAPAIFTMWEGKAVAECFADLADRALVVYEGSGFVQDPTIYALKAALAQAIAGKLDGILESGTLGASEILLGP